jgi:hypothetical protein
MQDYWNDPPDDQEPPEWYMTLEDVLEQMEPPESVAEVIRTAMEKWVEEYNAQHDYGYDYGDTPASESEREVAESVDEKPDGQAENKKLSD